MDCKIKAIYILCLFMHFSLSEKVEIKLHNIFNHHAKEEVIWSRETIKMKQLLSYVDHHFNKEDNGVWTHDLKWNYQVLFIHRLFATILNIYWCGRRLFPVWWLNEWGHPQKFLVSVLQKLFWKLCRNLRLLKVSVKFQHRNFKVY